MICDHVWVNVGQRLEVAAPQWIVELVRVRRAPVPWPDVVRLAVAVPTPLAVALLLGAGPVGVLAAMGALVTSLADKGGPLRLRVVRELGAGFAGAVGLLAGHLAAGAWWVAVPVVAVAALVSGLLSVINSATSMAGLQLLVYVSIGSGLRTPLPLWALPVLFLAGVVWAAALSVVQGVLQGTQVPERAAVAAVYRRAADMLAAGGDRQGDHDADFVPARQALTAAMNDAYDTLLAVRSRSAGRRPLYRQLAGLLNAATPVVEASVALAHTNRRVPDDVIAALQSVADAIDTRLPLPEELPPSLRDVQTPRLRTLRTGLKDVVRQLNHPPGEVALLPRTFRQRVITLTDQVLTGRQTWLYVVRLVLCMTVAEVLREVLPLPRSYWLVLTAAIVLKPDFGSVFIRAVQRALGTLVGVVLGAVLIAAVPHGAWLLPFMAVAAALLPVGQTRNFGMVAVFLTPLAVLLIDFGAPTSSPGIVLVRLLDTLAGCAVVLVVGYLLWPETWRVHLGPRISDAVDDLAGYVRVAFEPDKATRSRGRRRTYRSLSDVRTLFQQQLAEPPPVSTRAAAWWPVIVQLERAADAVTEAAIRATHGAPPPSRDGLNLLVADLRELATALRERRPPDDVPLPEDPPLAGTVAETRAALQLAAGPDVEDRDPGRL
jgi:uncharacterized membrane protein YccC